MCRTLQLISKGPLRPRLTVEERLQLFDAATERQKKRNAEWTGERYPQNRGWTREELYVRGRPR
jgi:hypothetical protein